MNRGCGNLSVAVQVPSSSWMRTLPWKEVISIEDGRVIGDKLTGYIQKVTVIMRSAVYARSVPQTFILSWLKWEAALPPQQPFGMGNSYAEHLCTAKVCPGCARPKALSFWACARRKAPNDTNLQVYPIRWMWCHFVSDCEKVVKCLMSAD